MRGLLEKGNNFQGDRLYNVTDGHSENTQKNCCTINKFLIKGCDQYFSTMDYSYLSVMTTNFLTKTNNVGMKIDILRD